MIDPTTLLTYIAIVAGFVIIPGPATVLTVARSASGGTKAGLATALGIAVGDVVHTVLAIIGLSALVLSSALVFSIVKYLGAAYLVYLGLTAIFAKVSAEPAAETPALPPKVAFRQAVLAEVLNPKTALFFVAFLPQFVNPAAGFVAAQLAVFGAILILLGFLSCVIFALAAGQASTAIRQNPTIQRWLNRITGGVFCAVGVRLALQDR